LIDKPAKAPAPTVSTVSVGAGVWKDAALASRTSAMQPTSRIRFVSRPAATLAFLVMLAAVTSADPGELQSTLERCARAPSLEARVGCLEAALAAAHGEAIVDAVEPATPGEARAAAALAEADHEPPAPAAATTDLGREQVTARSRTRSNEAPPERMRAQITGHSIVGYRTLQFELDNGQIWRQIAADTQQFRLPAEGSLTAEIWTSRYGGYQMRIEEVRRTIRVERLR
jgi:hypothetical protein